MKVDLFWLVIGSVLGNLGYVVFGVWLPERRRRKGGGQ